MKRYWWIFLLLAAVITAAVLFSPQPTVMTAGDLTLDNTGFAYYYWSEFFYFKEAYGEYLSGVVDFTQSLDSQFYADGVTWQDYLVEETLDVAADTLSMVLAAEEAGFTLPEDYAQSLSNTWDGFLEQSGGDLKAYLQDSYGKDADPESFYTYLSHCHMAAAYADHLYASLSPTEEEIEAYRADHQGEYLDEGITEELAQLWQAQEDLLAQLHGEQVRQLRAAADIRVNTRAIRIRAPKGLYE